MNALKTKTRKQHAAVIDAEAQMIVAIRNADHFLASLFVGRGEYQKCKAQTVAQAIVAASMLETAFPTTRRAMIYAVGADGIAVFITYELIAKLRAFLPSQK